MVFRVLELSCSSGDENLIHTVVCIMLCYKNSVPYHVTGIFKKILRKYLGYIKPNISLAEWQKQCETTQIKDIWKNTVYWG